MVAYMRRAHCSTICVHSGATCAYVQSTLSRSSRDRCKCNIIVTIIQIQRLFFDFILIFSRIKKKRRDASRSKELQEERAPPLCRCTEDDASKMNPRWRAGCSRSCAKFLLIKTNIYIQCLCVYAESVLLLQQA